MSAFTIDLLSRLGDPAKTTQTWSETQEIVNLFLLLSLSNIENIRYDSSTITPLFTACFTPTIQCQIFVELPNRESKSLAAETTSKRPNYKL